MVHPLPCLAFMNKELAINKVTKARVIFWDFDGVIKDSVPVKTEAFRKLFSPFGPDVVYKVVEHHLVNGGVSRYKKIPYYFKEYIGKNISQEELDHYSNYFSKLVVEEVINSPWIPGVEDFLRNNEYNQDFILVTGTPQGEIEIILEKLNLTELFISIHGAPKDKTDMVSGDIKKYGYKRTDCILIGDSPTDFKAAHENNIDFIFRGKRDLLDTFNSEYCIDDFMQVITHV
jgi:phosphoglycolate phosphatase-like HAD superfamily hydrolase